MFSDFLYALRTLIKQPKFSLLTIFVMTTGLGLCIYMFSFIQSTLTAPLPFEGGDKIRKITTIVDGVTYDGMTLSIHDYEDIKKQQTTLSQIDAFRQVNATITTSDKAIRYLAHEVSPTFFSISEGRAQLGRLITAQDLLPGAPKVTVLTHNLWQELFAGDENVIGRTLRIDTEPHTIVGVTQAAYRFPNSANIYLPFTVSSNGVSREYSSRVSVYGALKEGVSDEMLVNEIATFFEQFKKEYPELYANTKGYAWTFQEEAMGNGTRPIVVAMQISVALILVLACINVGNLLLSRAIERGKETAIRTALGAPRGKLIAQVMWESTVICIISGILGVLFAGWGLALSFDVLTSGLPIAAPFWWQGSMTSQSVVFALGITLLTMLITGLLPAWRATGGDINRILRDGTRGAQSKSSGLLSKLIVGAEVALSCLLIMLAGAFVNSVNGLNNADYGMNTEGYLTARVDLPGSRYDTDEKETLYYQNLSRFVKENSQVNDFAVAQSLPSSWGYNYPIAQEERDYGKEPKYKSANINVVSHNFFDIMGINLTQGRVFDSQDRNGSPLTAIVTENFAKQFYNGQSPIGKRIRNVSANGEWVTIIGVVNNIILGQPFDNNVQKATIFMSYVQNPRRNMFLVLQSVGEPNSARKVLERATLRLDRDVPAYDVQTLARGIESRVAGINFVSNVFLIFAAASLVLAFSGIYGVMSNSIVQKTQEIGVRRALGADDGNIRKHFLLGGLKQLIAGLVIGVPFGVVLTNMLAKSGIASGSLAVYIGVPILISVIIICAVLIPVHRTLKMEPSNALRYE